MPERGTACGTSRCRWGVAARAAAGLVLGEGAFDAPIVRQIEAAPGGVGESRLLRALRVAPEKLPAEVEGFADARGAFRRLGLGIERENQRRGAQGAAQQAAAGDGVIAHGISHKCLCNDSDMATDAHG